MNFYEVLGVKKDATHDEIKKAYKRLAMKHHPDRGGDTEKFAKITEAYEVLKDPKKRAQYDNPSFGGFGNRYTNQHGNYGFDVSSIFEDLFSQNGGFRRPSNSDLRMRAVLDLRESYTGKKFSGVYTVNGKQKTVDIDIPPGVTSGDTLRVPGAGDDSIQNMAPGDLLITVVVKPEPGWDIHNHDLLTSCEVNVFDLMMGTKVTISTPEGKTIKLTLKPGTQPNSVHVINGYGLPNPRTNSRGKIHVKITAFIPAITDKNHVQQLGDLKNALDTVS